MTYFNLHTHHFTNNPNIIEVVNQYPAEFSGLPTSYSIGIHPWHINKNTVQIELQYIKSKITELNCLAVGECGLDNRIDTPFDLQIFVFEQQLLVAQKHSKPVIIHCVGAFNELMSIKKKLNLTIPLLVHGYSKNEIVATTLISNGFYLSFGKYLMMNPRLREVFYSTPLDKLFLETDSSDYNIEEVYKQAAAIKGISIDELKYKINQNFEVVFKKF